MNTLNTRLTLNLLEQTNARRIIKQKPLLYPDDEILSLLQRKIPIGEIDKYSSCDQIFLICASSSIKCLSIHEDSITHLAASQTQSSQGNLVIICTVRPIAISQIALKLHSSYQLSIKAQRLGPMVHLWGCKAIPANTNSKETYSLITPAKIYEKQGRYLFQIPTIGVPYARLVFYGSNKKPFYERKIYDLELPDYAFTVYQMNIRYFKDFQNQAIQYTELYEQSNKGKKDSIKQNFLEVFNVDSLTLKNHRKSQNVMKEKRKSFQKAGRFTLAPQTMKRRNRIEDLSEQLLCANIQDQTIFSDCKPILNFQSEVLKKLQMQNSRHFQDEVDLNERINSMRKALHTKFFQMIKETQIQQTIRVNSGSIYILVPIQSIKNFNLLLCQTLLKQNQQNNPNCQAIIQIKQYPMKVLELLLSLNSRQFFDRLRKLSYQQIISAINMFSQLKISFLCQAVLIQTLTEEYRQSDIVQQWTDLRLLTTAYYKNLHLSQQINSVFEDWLDSTFSKQYQILQNTPNCKLDQVFAFMSLQKVEKLVIVALEQMNQACSEQEIFKMNNRLSDLLQIIMGNRDLKNVAQLMSKQQSKISIKQNKYDQNDQILQKKQLTYFCLRSELQIQNSISVQSKFYPTLEPKSIQTQFGKIQYQSNYVMACSFPFNMQKQRQIIVSQDIRIKDDLFKLTIEFNSKNPNILSYQLIKIELEQSKLFYKYTAVNVRIQFSKQTKIDDKFRKVHFDDFYYVWSNSSKKSYNPCNQFTFFTENAQQEMNSTMLMVTLRIDKNIIDQACLHYLGIRIRQLIPIQVKNPIEKIPKKRISEDLNKRKSCFFLQEARLALERMTLNCLQHQYCQICQSSQSLLYNLTEMQIFGLLQNDNIDVAEQWILLLFLVKYYYRKQNQQGTVPIKKQQIKNESLRRLSQKFGILDQVNQKSKETPMRFVFLTLRWQFISFKKILSTYIQQLFIQNDPIILSIIQHKRASIIGQKRETTLNQFKIKFTPNVPRIRTQLPSQEEYLNLYLNFKKLHKN